MTARSLFVLGGARSGKSRYAQTRAEATEGRHIFIATAEAFDDDMHARIARHQADRDQRWETLEAPLSLPGAIEALNQPDTIVLVDCLTLWISNLLLAGADIGTETEKLRRALERFRGHLILVANEVGFGIVPDNALARQFRDEAGRTNQIVADQADEVQLIMAGLSLRMK